MLITKEKYKQYRDAAKAKNPKKFADQKKGTKLKSKYGITIEDFKAMHKSQRARCKCCKEKFTDAKTTHVDFDAENKKVRGLLCANCNVALAYLKEDEHKIESLLSYVRGF